MESLARVESAADAGGDAAAGVQSCYRGFGRTAGRNWPKFIPRALWGCFLLLISFLARFETFDLLSKVKYTKMVLYLVNAVSGKALGGIGRN